MKKIKNFKLKLLSLLAVSSVALTTVGTVLWGNSALAENSIATDALFTSNTDMDVSYGTTDENGSKGVTLTLNNMLEKQKAVLQYNSYVEKEDIGDALIRFSVLPSDIGVQDFECVVVTATDAVDPTQQLSIAVAPQSNGWWTTYASSWVALTDELTPIRKSAYSNSMVLQLDGTYQNAVGINEFLGTNHAAWTGKYMDTGARMNKNGYFTRDNAETTMKPIRLAFDGTNAWRNSAVVASLSDPEFFAAANVYLENTKFESRYTEEYVNNLFSSGYCTIKMSFLSPLTDVTKIHISQIGKKLFNLELDAEYSQPYFLIDKEKEAVVGYEYELPKFSVKDVQAGDLTSKTVCQFIDVSGQEITVVDNKATLTKAGKYAIRLTVENGGKTYVKEFPIICYEEMPTTHFEIDNRLESIYQTGERIVLTEFRAFSEVNCKDGGYLEAFAVLELDGETLATCSMNETMTYTLEKEGLYTVSYVAQNAYGVHEIETYAFSVEKGLHFTDYKTPLAFRKGQTNTVSDFSVINYVNGTAESKIYRAVYLDDTQIYLAQGNRVIYGSLTVSEFTEDSVELIYKAGFAENELSYQKGFTVPVIEPLYIEDWFLTYDENGSISTIGAFEDNSEKMIFNATQDGALVFSNYIATSDFSVQFAYGAEKKDDFKTAKIILENPSDHTEYVELALRYLSGTQSMLFINGEARGKIDGTLIDATKGFTWVLSKDGRSLQTLDGSTVANLDRWYDGRMYDGFESGALILKFAFDGIVEGKNVPFHLTSISNQTLFTSYILEDKATFMDVNAPIIYTYGTFENVEKAYGYVFSIPAATAYDVLQTNVAMRLRVLAPNNEYALTSDDLTKSNSVKLDQYGIWTVIITAEDVKTGVKMERRIVVTVKDKISPKLNVSGKIYSEYKVGKNITFPSATATDNATENVQVFLIVISENGMREMADNFQYAFTKKGKYKLVYYAIDDSYNASKIIYEVTVK